MNNDTTVSNATNSWAGAALARPTRPCVSHWNRRETGKHQMRALSVRQPWASLVASGRKTIELRSWRTDYRGPVLILAGASAWQGEHGFELGPRGVAICLVDLVDCRPVTRADSEAACIVPPDGYDWGLVLANPRAVRQAPAKGKLGLYRPDATLLRAVGIP